MAVPFLVVFLADHPRPTTRQAQAGDHHLNFYESRDNLPELARIMERPRRNRDADTIMYRHWRGSLSAAPRNCRDPRSDTS
jgi:hypothetical protein